MSLVCGNCGEDVGPSEDLPGREAVMVSPFVTASYWTINEDGSLGQDTGYAASSIDAALCLCCVEKQVPKERLASLQQFYELYQQEKAFGETYDSIGGHLPVNWMTVVHEQYNRRITEGLAKEFSGMRQACGDAGLFGDCMICGTKITDLKPAPYFQARGIDRVLSSKVLSGIPFLTSGNYSFSFLQQGLCTFPICFSCFAKLFPTMFANLTSGMGRNHLPKQPGPASELILTASFVDRLMAEGTPESLKSVSAHLEALAQDGALRIDLDK